MDHLLRGLAPVSDAGWALLDEEARARLSPALAARRLVDFSGPHGWEYSASNLGRTSAVSAAPADGISGLARQVLPVVELRADFELARAELDAGDRGADDVDLGELDRAAHRVAVAENAAVFHGWEGAVTGIAQASPHEQVSLGESADVYPRHVAEAVERLLCSGIAGPYGLALGPEQYRRVVQTAEHGGYPLLDHLAKILEGPIVWAPGVQGALVISLRGGDFAFHSGQDLSIGYQAHTSDTIQLYLQESFTFHTSTPEAAIALKP